MALSAKDRRARGLRFGRPREFIGRFLVVEDDARQQRALGRRLEHHRPVDIASTISQARLYVASHAPYIGYVVDVDLPDGDGLRFLEQIRRTVDPKAPALVVTGHAVTREMLLEVGTLGRVLPKPGPDLTARQFIEGLNHFAAAALKHEETELGMAGALFDLSNGELSPAEWEVALLGALGYGRREIAVELGVSENTVSTHVGAVLEKCGLKGQGLRALSREIEKRRQE